MQSRRFPCWRVSDRIAEKIEQKKKEKRIVRGVSNESVRQLELSMFMLERSDVGMFDGGIVFVGKKENGKIIDNDQNGLYKDT